MSNDVVVTMESQSITLNHVSRYLAAKHHIKIFKVDGYRKNIYGNIEVDFKCGIHKTTIDFQGNKIEIDYTRNDAPKGTSYTVNYFEELIIKAKNIEIIDNLILESKKFAEEKDENYVTTKILKKGYWSTLSRLPKRDISTIYIDSKDEIINDINNFLEEEETYSQFGIPYKRNYLFEGPPGSGKSSFIFAIGSLLNRDINILSFSPELDDGLFMQAINNMSDNAILVLEDIDSLFVGRKSNDMNSCLISFSGILNFLDGAGRKHGMICFLTTNYIDRLDNALKRAGRIDYILSFDYITKNQIKNMYTKFFPDQLDNLDEFLEKLYYYKFTTAILQDFFFRNRTEKSILAKINKLTKTIEDRQKPPSDFGNLYT